MTNREGVPAERLLLNVAPIKITLNLSEHGAVLAVISASGQGDSKFRRTLVGYPVDGFQ